MTEDEKVLPPAGWIDIEGDGGQTVTYVRTRCIQLVQQKSDGAIVIQLRGDCRVDLPDPGAGTLLSLMDSITGTDL